VGTRLKRLRDEGLVTRENGDRGGDFITVAARLAVGAPPP